MTGLHFRRATPDDLPVLLDVERRSFERTWPEGAFEQELRLSQAEVWMVFGGGGEADGGPLGYADFWVVAGEVSLMNIAVVPEGRRRGLGAALLRRVEERGRELGGDALFLEVRASNEAALGLYLAHGYSQIGVRKGYYSDTGEDAVVLSRMLEEPSAPGSSDVRQGGGEAGGDRV